MTLTARLLLRALVPLAFAASPAMAQDSAARPFSLTLPSTYSTRLLPPERPARDPLSLALPRLDRPAEDPWYRVLPIVGAGGVKSREKGFSFGLRPGKSPKAVARFRF